MARRTLLRGGHIYCPVDPFATAMLVLDDTVAWIGDDAGADVHRRDVDEVIELDGALVTPGFVDSHVHTTATGLLLTGVDLTGCTSLADMIDRLRPLAGSTDVLIGHGWDDTTWPEARPPATSDVDQALGGRPCYLSRIDGHSAVVSTATRLALPDLPLLAGWSIDGPLTKEAHHHAREAAMGSLSPEQTDRAQRAALARALSLGIVSLHEMAGPSVSSADDLTAVLALANEPGMPAIVGYWGELDGHDHAIELGARGAGGDLCVDGSLGSRTACLRVPYRDASTSTGSAYLDPQEIARHVAEASRRGLQSGFHVIGDRAHDIVMSGFAVAAADVGVEAIRRARHRLEHAEMPGDHTRAMADLGIVASVQSAFDGLWGGSDGMYAARLGVERSRTMNPLARMSGEGVILALGSDAPVTPLDPWGSVRAAAFHQTPEHRVSVRAAFAAHTRGGRRAAAEEAQEPGVLAPGTPATYAIWNSSALVVQAPDERIAAWSTDPRSGTPGLPDLTPGAPLPTCARTVIKGHVAYDSGDLS